MTGTSGRGAVGGGGFEVVVVANGDYRHRDVWPPLPVAQAAATLVAALARSGGTIRDQPHLDLTAEQARRVLAGWVSGPSAGATVLYWGGHGYSDGTTHWLVTADTKAVPDAARALRAADLEPFLLQDWYRRTADEGSWTVVVLDCCGAGVGVRNLSHALSGQGPREPRRLALVAACEEAASFSGRFAEEVGKALGRLTENDEPSVLRFFGDVAAAVRGEVRPSGAWTDARRIANPRATGGVLTVALDALSELRAALERLPPQRAREVRSHFMAKAQGAELGEGGWYFRGRQAETARVVAWLKSAERGMLVVTGAAGAGKSALLGRLVVLADPGLAGALASAGLLGQVPPAGRPPPDVFDVVIHLTGKTLAECVARVAEAIPTLQGAPVTDPDRLLDALRDLRRPIGWLPRPWRVWRFTVLVDALDESQQPHAIAASLLRRLAATAGVRVVVGTRRSLAEGPDLPEPADRSLLDALGVVDDLVVVDSDGDAVRAYADARLTASPTSPFSLQPARGATAEAIAARRGPFLFARLAVTEMLARPELAGDAAGVEELLAAGHRGLFAAAVERLGRRSATTVALLRALAFGLGRGLPRAGGVWEAVCAALTGPDRPRPRRHRRRPGRGSPLRDP